MPYSTSRTVRALGALLAWALAVSGASCGDDEDCSNGSCVCDSGDSCTLGCEGPPCHVLCRGDNPSCRGACGNGDCSCGPRSSCQFLCAAPPCHVACGPDTACTGECANGDCLCAEGSRCDFQCLSGPCHVDCEGSNPRCTGECANGSCRCGPGSNCDFVCEAGPCAGTCEAGAACILRCPSNDAGTQNCSFSECAAGAPTLCPGGGATTCNAACPAS